MASQSDMPSQDLYEDQDDQGRIRLGILFLVDGTLPMFDEDPIEGITYFQICIKKFIEILRIKLLRKSSDWMGIILYGTNEWDKDEHSERKHILTLVPFDHASVAQLKTVLDIDRGKWRHYKSIASSEVYPLHDVVSYADLTLAMHKNIPMYASKVMLFTCRHEPPLTTDEKVRIRVKCGYYANTNIKIHVAGLGANWNHNKFYKGLEQLAWNVDNKRYKRPSLEDVIEEAKHFDSHVALARLPLKFPDLEIDVAVYSTVITQNYPKTVVVSKETNEILTPKRHWRSQNQDDDEEDEEDDLEMEYSDVVGQTYVCGGREITVTAEHLKHINKRYEIGLYVLGVQPIRYDASRHVREAQWVTWSNLQSKSRLHRSKVRNGPDQKRKPALKPRFLPDDEFNSKTFFGALLHTCQARKLMILCIIKMRKSNAPKLCCMIPDVESGGFYLYRLPSKEEVRDLSEQLDKLAFTDEDGKPPIDEKGVQLFTNIITELKIDYTPKLFPNPKQELIQQNVETLALDEEPREPPVDCTLPPMDETRRTLSALTSTYEDVFGDEVLQTQHGPSVKRVKTSGDSVALSATGDTDVSALVRERKVESCTLPQLKEILKQAKLKVSGSKSELVKRIYENLS